MQLFFSYVIVFNISSSQANTDLSHRRFLHGQILMSQSSPFYHLSDSLHSQQHSS